MPFCWHEGSCHCHDDNVYVHSCTDIFSICIGGTWREPCIVHLYQYLCKVTKYVFNLSMFSVGLQVKAVKCMLLAESTQFVKAVQWRKHVASMCDVFPGKVFRELSSNSCMDTWSRWPLASGASSCFRRGWSIPHLLAWIAEHGKILYGCHVYPYIQYFWLLYYLWVYMYK